MSWVQGTTTESFYGSAELTLNVTAGDALILTAGTYGSGPFDVNLFHGVVVIDDKGNRWQQVSFSPSQQGNVSDVITAAQIATWVAYNCRAGSTNITISGFSSDTSVLVDEYSGVGHIAALDQVNINSTVLSSGASSIDSGNITTTSNELVYSAVFCNGASVTFTPSMGFNARQLKNNVHLSLGSFDKVSTGGTINNVTSLSATPVTIHSIILALSSTAIPSIVVQSASISVATISPIPLPVTLPYNTTEGNLLIARIRLYERLGPVLTDTQGNAWTVVESADLEVLCMAYCRSNGGPLTVTLNTTGGGDDVSILFSVTEYSLQNPRFFSSSEGFGTGETTQSTGLVVAPSTGSLLVSALEGYLPAIPPTITTGEYETLQISDCGLFAGNPSYLVGAHYTTPAPGSYETIFTAPANDTLHAMILGFVAIVDNLPLRCANVQPSGIMPSIELTRDLDADWDSASTFYITQDEPLPFTLRGLVLRMSYNAD